VTRRDDAERSDEEERRNITRRDDAERSDEEERRNITRRDDAERSDEEERRNITRRDDAERSDEEERRNITRRAIGQVTLLTNPASGYGKAPHAAERATARLQQRGIDVVEIVGSDAQHARRLTDAALDHGTDALVVAGGDGVIADALQALARTDIPLGIIPAGSGNDHAREYAIPTKDPVAAADVVADGWIETVDLGRIRDHKGFTKWFGTVAAAGFDSLVTDRANRMRWPRGRMRYNLAMLAELSQLRLLPFRLTLDGRDEIVTDLTLAAFGNTRSYGGGMLICPNADHSDGLLDITMVHSASRARLIRLFPTVYKGTHVDLDEVSTARAASVEVDSPGINVYADGELICPLPAEISAVAGALQILRPRG
jgi:diacylglycerol kinase (ATP)